MTTDIRSIRSSEVDAVFNIAQQDLFPRWSREDYRYFLSQSAGFCLGVFVENKLAAFFLSLMSQREMDIVAIVCASAQRRKGLAFQLLTEALMRSRAERATLEVDPANEAAVKLYLKAGFLVKGLRKKYYEGKNDAWTMVWEPTSASESTSGFSD